MPRAPKKCGKFDCEIRTSGAYCDVHTAQRQARVNTTQRGYGWKHQQHRARMIAAYVPGQLCTRCSLPIEPNDAVSADHDDTDQTRYLGLAHQRCNSQAGAALSHTPRATRWGSPPTPSDS